MERPSKKIKTIAWTTKMVEDEKAAIKLVLDKIQVEHGTKARLAHVIEQVEFLEKDTSDTAVLRRIVFCISGLIHHSRWGGLSNSQMAKLKGIVDAVLNVSD